MKTSLLLSLAVLVLALSNHARAQDDGGGLTITTTGTGTATLGGANSYTGGTTVSAGTLIVDEAYGLTVSDTNPAAPPPVNTGTSGGVSISGATLNLGNSSTGAGGVTITSGSTLSGVGIIGAGTVGGAVTLSSGSTVVGSGLGLLTGSSAVPINTVGGLTYSGTISGANTYSGITTISSGVISATSGSITGVLDIGSGAVSINNYSPYSSISSVAAGSAYSGVVLYLYNGYGSLVPASVVPEPSTWALLIGSVVGLIFFRRFRLAQR